MRIYTWLAVLLLVFPQAAGAAPTSVRFTESTAHAFLVLKSAGGEPLAHGEYVQWPKGDRIEAQLTLRFADGSLRDETLAFTQRRVFRLVSYHLTQRGPSFREPGCDGRAAFSPPGKSAVGPNDRYGASEPSGDAPEAVGHRSLRSNDTAVPYRSASMSLYGALLSAGSSVPISGLEPSVETRNREVSTPSEKGCELSRGRSTSGP